MESARQVSHGDSFTQLASKTQMQIVGHPLNGTLRVPRDLDEANKRWEANCFPGALAAALGISVGDVRPFFPWFHASPYTNIPRGDEAIGAAYSAGRCRSWRPIASSEWPAHGVALVQFTGPWTAPDANKKWAAMHTHAIAVAAREIRGRAGLTRMVYDVNAVSWAPLETWEAIILPKTFKEPKRSTGYYVKAAWFLELS
jgi:hypothetical protein